ncbi:DUF1523 family protein [Kiloniella sp.]|uniref:DUF1523 family protein n=1 Tax=Kiloniella sp. TaxID=1938587 RepID=UPI003B0144A7
MQIVKWAAGLMLVILLGGFLHYNLPGQDIVRVVGTDVKRMDTFGLFDTEAPKTNPERTRDVRFVNTAWPDATPRVYRNEDTDWHWPPYLKFDSGNLQAQSQAWVSTEADPIWVVVTHYGWRIPILSLFPNAVDIRRAEGPTELIIPWFNIFFFVSFGILGFMIWNFLTKIKRRHIDPALEDVSEVVSDISSSAEAASEKTRQTGNKFGRWIDTWRPKHKRKYK